LSNARRSLFSVLIPVVRRIGPDNISLASAGVAFYWLLAVFPAMSLLLSIYGLVADPDDVARQLTAIAAGLPDEVHAIIEAQLAQVAGGDGGALTVSAVLSFWFTLWSATRGTTALMEGLNIAFGVRERRNVFKKLAVALSITFCLAIGLSAVFGIVAVLPGVLVATGLPVESVPMAWARWPLLWVGIALFAGLLYRWGPCGRRRLGPVFTPGALAGAAMQLTASGGFSWYVSNFGSYNETYGSMGAVVIMMLWLYLSAFVLLVGAEVDSELSGPSIEGPPA
jgi:membrane protein